MQRTYFETLRKDSLSNSFVTNFFDGVCGIVFTSNDDDA